MEVTPQIPPGRQFINGYQPGRFRVSGTVHTGSIIVFPDRTLAWPVTALEQVTVESLAPVREAVPAVEVVLLGSGARMALLPAALRRALRGVGLNIEVMDTGAA